LQPYGKDIAIPLAHLLNRRNPLFLAVRLIATARTLNDAEISGYEFVWAEAIFLHVLFAVGAMLGEVSSTDHAAVVAADTAANKVDAIAGTEALRPRLGSVTSREFYVVKPATRL
jgi:hypothetical protein